MNSKDMIIERQKDRWFYGMFAVPVVMLAVLSYVSINRSLQSDEIFSIDLINHSWSEMIQLAIGDVHPPLYYAIIKICADVIGGDLYQRLLVAQVVSVLSLWLLFLLAVTVIRRHLGRRVALLFSGSLIGFPSLIHISTELRMYGWGMLFVTIAALMAVFIMRREDSRATWAILMISSIAACYTHYFCDAAIFYIYVFLLLWLLRFRKENVRALLIQAVIVVALFLPWMSSLGSQVSGVAEDYWMTKEDAANVSDYIKFLVSPYTNVSIIRVPLALMLVAVALIMFFRALRHRQWVQVYLMSLVPCLLVTGIVMNVMFRPVYESRYATVASGALCLGLAMGIAQLLPAAWPSDYKIRKDSLWTRFALAAVMIIAAISTIDMLSFVKNQRAYKKDFDVLMAELLDPAQDAIDAGETVSIITDSAYFHSAFAYYLPGATVYRPGWSKFDYSQRQSNPDNLAAYTEGMELPQGDVWVVHSSLEDDTLLQMIDVSATVSMDARLEQTGMTIYHIGD